MAFIRQPSELSPQALSGEQTEDGSGNGRCGHAKGILMDKRLPPREAPNVRRADSRHRRPRRERGGPGRGCVPLPAALHSLSPGVRIALRPGLRHPSRPRSSAGSPPPPFSHLLRPVPETCLIRC